MKMQVNNYFFSLCYMKKISFLVHTLKVNGTQHLGELCRCIPSTHLSIMSVCDPQSSILGPFQSIFYNILCITHKIKDTKKIWEGHTRNPWSTRNLFFNIEKTFFKYILMVKVTNFLSLAALNLHDQLNYFGVINVFCQLIMR